MLSMKYVGQDGIEHIHGDIEMTRATVDEGGRLVVTGYKPDNTAVAFFQDEEVMRDPKTSPRLYIMNGTGATIATYRMGVKPPKAETQIISTDT